MIPSLYTIEQARDALREIGGLPVAICAEYNLRDDGIFVAKAKTNEEFEAGVAAAIQLASSKSCFIHRST